MLLTTIIIFAFFQKSIQKGIEFGPEYGVTWTFYTDDDAIPHYVNLTHKTEIRPLCSSFSTSDISYELYTPRNKNRSEILEIPHHHNSNLTSQYFTPEKRTIILTHGWFGSNVTDWLLEMKDKFIREFEYNVVIVGWKEIASNPDYTLTACRTRHVGRLIGKLAKAIQRSFDYDTVSMLHLIGHGLGAHVMGFAGKAFRGEIDRITGLDPARPQFEFPFDRGPENRLDRTDARFVDVIHTSGGCVGIKYSYASADFYPNGGNTPQPGCGGRLDMAQRCSHRRAIQFFIESLNYDARSKEGFSAYPCSDWEKFQKGECKVRGTSMGNPASYSNYGNFYLYTYPQMPYSQGKSQNE